MILAVGNTKGGVGKTTLAVNLAVARALAGRDLLLVDGDEQGTALTFTELRAERLGEAGYTAVALTGAALPAGSQPFKCDIIIDVGGRDTGCCAPRQPMLLVRCSRAARWALDWWRRWWPGARDQRGSCDRDLNGSQWRQRGNVIGDRGSRCRPRRSCAASVSRGGRGRAVVEQCRAAIIDELAALVSAVLMIAE